MSYRNHTLAKLKATFGLRVNNRKSLFLEVPERAPSQALQQELEIKLPLGLRLSNEKARSEMIIAPILVEILRQHREQMSLFSGVEFNVDDARGLVGVCDFLISRSSNDLVVEDPVLAIVEAKREDIMGGVAQCLAEMIAARTFNKAAGQRELVYGAVTSGSEWRFLKLEGDNAFIDADEYFITQLSKILGILSFIIEQNPAG